MNPTTYADRMAAHEGGQHPERDPNCERCAVKPAATFDIAPTWASLVGALVMADAYDPLEQMAAAADKAVAASGILERADLNDESSETDKIVIDDLLRLFGIIA